MIPDPITAAFLTFLIIISSYVVQGLLTFMNEHSFLIIK